MIILGIVFLLGAVATYCIGSKELERDTDSTLIVILFGLFFAILSLLCFIGGLNLC